MDDDWGTGCDRGREEKNMAHHAHHQLDRALYAPQVLGTTSPGWRSFYETMQSATKSIIIIIVIIIIIIIIMSARP